MYSFCYHLYQFHLVGVDFSSIFGLIRTVMWTNRNIHLTKTALLWRYLVTSPTFVKNNSSEVYFICGCFWNATSNVIEIDVSPTFSTPYFDDVFRKGCDIHLHQLRKFFETQDSATPQKSSSSKSLSWGPEFHTQKNRNIETIPNFQATEIS